MSGVDSTTSSMPGSGSTGVGGGASASGAEDGAGAAGDSATTAGGGIVGGIRLIVGGVSRIGRCGGTTGGSGRGGRPFLDGTAAVVETAGRFSAPLADAAARAGPGAVVEAADRFGAPVADAAARAGPGAVDSAGPAAGAGTLGVVLAPCDRGGAVTRDAAGAFAEPEAPVTRRTPGAVGALGAGIRGAKISGAGNGLGAGDLGIDPVVGAAMAPVGGRGREIAAAPRAFGSGAATSAFGESPVSPRIGSDDVFARSFGGAACGNGESTAAPDDATISSIDTAGGSPDADARDEGVVARGSGVAKVGIAKVSATMAAVDAANVSAGIAKVGAAKVSGAAKVRAAKLSAAMAAVSADSVEVGAGNAPGTLAAVALKKSAG
jgi:hypothetical protein